MNNGRFIVLEGVEGVGKSTQLNYLLSYLATQKFSVVATREPGGTPIAEAIRDLLLSHHDEVMCPETEALLMFAARMQHMQHVILPALKRGDWVVSDRFVDASFAYQAGGRQLNQQHIYYLSHWIVGECQPDLVIYLDCPPEVGLQRVKQHETLDRIEVETLAFFNRVRDAYLERANQAPERFTVIDASQSIEDVQAQIQMCLQSFIAKVG